MKITFAIIAAAACAAAHLAAAIPHPGVFDSQLEMQVEDDIIITLDRPTLDRPDHLEDRHRQLKAARSEFRRAQQEKGMHRADESDLGPAGFHPEAPDASGHLKPEITTLGASVDGHVTYRLEARLASSAHDIYAIYGDKNALMELPPAYQVDAPFGADIGGVSPQIVGIKPEAAFDSWLTVGLTDGVGGSRDGRTMQIASTGVDFASWTASSGLRVDDGAVFYMEPNDAPTDRRMTIAQLTIPEGADWEATVSAQGHSARVSAQHHAGEARHGSWDQALRFEHKCPHHAAPPAAAAADAAAKPCSQPQLAVLRRCAADCASCDATKVAVVLGGCALPAGSSASGVPCATVDELIEEYKEAGYVETFAPAVPPTSMIASVDINGDGANDLPPAQAGRTWGSEYARLPSGAAKAADSTGGATLHLTADEAPGLEEALAGQHGGMFKWMMSFVSAH